MPSLCAGLERDVLSATPLFDVGKPTLQTYNASMDAVIQKQASETSRASGLEERLDNR